jgi:hypothetical protein
MNKKGQNLKCGHSAGYEQKALQKYYLNVNMVVWTSLMHVAYLKIVKKWYNQGLSVKKYE